MQSHEEIARSLCTKEILSPLLVNFLPKLPIDPPITEHPLLLLLFASCKPISKPSRRPEIQKIGSDPIRSNPFNQERYTRLGHKLIGLTTNIHRYQARG